MPKACDINLINDFIQGFLESDYRAGRELLPNLRHFSLFDKTKEGEQFQESYLRFLALKKINFLRTLRKFPEHLDDIDIDSPLQEFRPQLQAIIYLKTIKTLPCSIHINESSPLFIIRDLLSFYSDFTPERIIAELTPLRLYLHLVGPILRTTVRSTAEVEPETEIRAISPIEKKVAELAKAIVKLEQEVDYLDELGLTTCCHSDMVDFTIDKLMAKDELIFHSLLLESLCSEVGVSLPVLFNLFVPGCPDCNAESYIGCCSQSLAMYPYMRNLRERRGEFKTILISSCYDWLENSTKDAIIDLFLKVMEKRWRLSTVQGLDSLNWIAFYKKYMAIPTTVVISPVRFPKATEGSKMKAFLEQCAENPETSLFSKVVQKTCETPEILTPRSIAILNRMD
ncbi:MAG: hypothetical protein KBD64_04560 [Gammaproteobacteria bacterium]|nr:hypothetical protein [Gammaproteobacteria bacterium]